MTNSGTAILAASILTLAIVFPVTLRADGDGYSDLNLLNVSSDTPGATGQTAPVTGTSLADDAEVAKLKADNANLAAENERLKADRKPSAIDDIWAFLRSTYAGLRQAWDDARVSAKETQAEIPVTHPTTFSCNGQRELYWECWRASTHITAEGDLLGFAHPTSVDEIGVGPAVYYYESGGVLYTKGPARVKMQVSWTIHYSDGSSRRTGTVFDSANGPLSRDMVEYVKKVAGSSGYRTPSDSEIIYR